MTKILRTQYKIWPIFSSGTLCISMQGRKRTEQLIEKREYEKPTQGIAVTILCMFRLWKEEPKGRSELRSEVDVGVVRRVRIIVLCIVAMDSDSSSSSRGKIQKTNKQNVMLMRKEIEVKEKKTKEIPRFGVFGCPVEV